jgi:hypothetical protein
MSKDLTPQQIANILGAGIDLGVKRVLQLAKGKAMEQAPYEFGNLQAGIDVNRIRIGDNISIGDGVSLGGLVNPIKYDIFVQQGTGIFKEGGGGRQTPWVYFNEKGGRFVYTQGGLPNPYMRRALILMRPLIPKIIEKAIVEAYQ